MSSSLEQVFQSTLDISLHPTDFFTTKTTDLLEGLKELFDIVIQKKLHFHSKQNEFITGVTNLLITATCLFLFLITLQMKVRTFYEKIRKFFCLLFDISLSSGAFVGFMVHSFEFESELLDKLWLSLYTLLLFSIAIRYLLTFWESGLFLFILFVPLLGITGYYFLICCWFTNKFICIGGFVLIFGIIMGLSHCLYICTRNSKYFLYLLSDIVALCSIVIQASSLQVGDIDKNGFFHIGITLYMFFFHFAFSEVTKSSQSKIKKN